MKTKDEEILESLIQSRDEKVLEKKQKAELDEQKSMQKDQDDKQALIDLYDRLSKLKKPLTKKISLNVNYNKKLGRITASYGALPQILCAPAVITEISIKSQTYSIFYKTHEDEMRDYHLTQDQVVEKISDLAARMLSGEISQPYRLPRWYLLVGKNLGILAFAFAGLVGIFIGVFAFFMVLPLAIFVYWTSKYIWPFYLLAFVAGILKAYVG